MKTIRHLPLLALLITLAGCSLAAREEGADSAPEASKKLDDRVVKLFGGEKSMTAFAADSNVTAWRIAPEQVAADDPDAADAVAGYKRISGPVEVDLATWDGLEDILWSAGSYHFDSAKACEFLPGVVVRFEKDDVTVDVLFCFSCDELAVQVGGKRVGGEDFVGRVRPKLVRIMKEIFPGDEVIQELKETSD